MVSFFLCFLWSVVILCSLTGWGGMINRILFPMRHVDWSQRAAWGLSFSIVVGGILNVTWTIYREVLFIYLGLGFLFFIFDFLVYWRPFAELLFRWRSSQKDAILVIGVVTVMLLTAVQYAGSVHTSRRGRGKSFNPHDDYQAYLVFPQKMLQMHSLGPDSFSERRIVSSLGGQAFLQTFILSIFPEENVFILDHGIAYVMALGLLIGCFCDQNMGKKKALLLVFLFLATPLLLYVANITSVVTSLVLFICLFRVLDGNVLEPNRPFPNAFIIALVAAGICCLKSTNIVPCVVLLVSSYIFYLLQAKSNWKSVLLECGTSIVLVVIFLLPWMVSMYQSCGTLLYPILGRGYHGSVYGTFLLPNSEMNFRRLVVMTIVTLSSIHFIAFVILVTVNFKSMSHKISGRASLISLVIGTGLGSLILCFAIGGVGIKRYSFAFLCVAVFMLMAKVFTSETSASNKLSASMRLCCVFLVAGMILGEGISNFTLRTQTIVFRLQDGLRGIPLVSDEERHRYARMQQSIPQSEVVLERLDKPFLLNFRRNRIYVADLPGGASLPPGMPSFKGAEALADYLISNSIRYVAYSYATEANYTREKYSYRLRPTESPWVKSGAEHTFDFQDNLKKLGETRERIYDDNDIFVLDLLRRCGQQ